MGRPCLVHQLLGSRPPPPPPPPLFYYMIKGLGCIVICVKCEGGNAKTPQLLCLPHAHKGARLGYVGGWVGGWVGVRHPPTPGGGGGTFVGLWVCQNSGW